MLGPSLKNQKNKESCRMSEEELNDQSTAIIKRNRFFGLLIIAIVTVPMLLAYVMYQTGWGISANTTNKGELLTPALSIQDLQLTAADNILEKLLMIKEANNSANKSTTKKWRLLVPVTAECSDVCQKNLYTTRQVHIRLAEKAYRVERIILSLDELNPALLQRLDNEHPNTLRVSSSDEHFSRWLAPANIAESAEQYYYLIDQEGFAMMRYDVSHTGQNLLDDIKKLLKFTYDK
jgi:cytochrome oxidase Cu insertion factor (SCO1/SenC/PrrC family)